MCIIIIKKKGMKPPTEQVLEACFKNNPDGAGFMYLKNYKIIIDKGYMDIDSLNRRLDELNFQERDTVVYHFRFATSGHVTERQTHPFPLSEKNGQLESLLHETNVGFAHNGIFRDILPRGSLSDTMVFVKDILSSSKIRKNIFKDEDIFNLITLATIGSKLVFFSNKHGLKCTGEWIEDKGLLFSNTGYVYIEPTRKHLKAEWYESYTNKPQERPLELQECPLCLTKNYDFELDECFNCDLDYV